VETVPPLVGAAPKCQATQHVNLLKGFATVAHSRRVWWSGVISVLTLVGCSGGTAVPTIEPVPDVSTVRGSFNLEAQARAQLLATPVVVMLEPLVRGTLAPMPPRVIRVTSSTDLFAPQFVVADTADTLVFVNGGSLKHEFFSPQIGMDVSYPLGAKSEFWSFNFLGVGVRTFFCRLHHDETFSIYVSDTPFHAVPDQHGHYVIADVPEGGYRLRMWSAVAEGPIRSVQVDGEGQVIENIWLNLSGSKE